MSSDSPKYKAFLTFAGVGTGKDLPTNALAAGKLSQNSGSGDVVRAEIEAEIQADFRALEDQAAAQPGLNDLLAAYGGYDAAIHQADAYLVADQQVQVFSTTDSAG